MLLWKEKLGFLELRLGKVVNLITACRPQRNIGFRERIETMHLYITVRSAVNLELAVLKLITTTSRPKIFYEFVRRIPIAIPSALRTSLFLPPQPFFLKVHYSTIITHKFGSLRRTFATSFPRKILIIFGVVFRILSTCPTRSDVNFTILYV